jgi:hypothetical protein
LIDQRKGTKLANGKESYRYEQAALVDPPQANFFPPAPSLAS